MATTPAEQVGHRVEVGYGPGGSGMPMEVHMSQNEVACYSRLLASARSVVEYGSGGSTLLALRLSTGPVYSVESDGEWLAKLRELPAIGEAEASGRLTLRHAFIGPTKKWGRPIDQSGRGGWPGYVTAPWNDECEADLILVDGRFRVACILQAVLMGEPHTRIVAHDFWNRPRYHAALEFVEKEEAVDTLAVFRRRPDHDSWRLVKTLKKFLDDPE